MRFVRRLEMRDRRRGAVHQVCKVAFVSPSMGTPSRTLLGNKTNIGQLHLQARREKAQFQVMPRYFFDIHNGHPHHDEVGEELKDDHAAWREALRLTRDVEDVLTPGGSWRLQVRSREAALFQIEIDTKWN